MNNLEELLARVQAIVTEKSSKTTTCTQKHALILYYYLLFKIHGDKQYLERVHVKLKESIAELLRQDSPVHNVLSFPIIPNLYAENLVSGELNKYVVLLDHHLFNKAFSLLSVNNTNFFEGALGIIHYFAECLPNPRIEGYLRTLLPSLCDAVEGQYRYMRTLGPLCLGIPDGLSGVLLVLMKCYERGLREEQLKKIIRAAILKLISYRLDVDFSAQRYSVFPDAIAINTPESNATYSNALCWCNGDLNKSLLFYKATPLFLDVDLSIIADLVGLNTILRKSRSTTNITDSHFSQGSSGLAQTYRFLFDTTQNHAYQACYAFWIGQTIELLGHELDSGFHDNKELDVLDGLVGVALTLLSYNSGSNIKWSHCLLL